MKLFGTLCLLLAISFGARAEVVVSVSINNPNTYTGLEEDEIKRIFLGKSGNFPDGSKAIAYDLPKGDKARMEFSQRYLDKTESQLNSYWSRRVFAGKQQPPKRVKDSTEMKAKVAASKHAVGYINSFDVDPSVVVIHSFK